MLGRMSGFVGREMGCVEIAVVDHLEGDAGFDECLVPAEGVVFDFGGVVVATVVPGGLLRVDEGDAGQRLLVGEVRLILFGPEDRSVRRRLASAHRGGWRRIC